MNEKQFRPRIKVNHDRHQINQFTVVFEGKAGVDLVLIQPFLLSYINCVVLILTTVVLFRIISIRKEIRRFVSKHGHPQPRF